MFRIEISILVKNKIRRMRDNSNSANFYKVYFSKTTVYQEILPLEENYPVVLYPVVIWLIFEFPT